MYARVKYILVKTIEIRIKKEDNETNKIIAELQKTELNFRI